MIFHHIRNVFSFKFIFEIKALNFSSKFSFIFEFNIIGGKGMPPFTLLLCSRGSIDAISESTQLD
jgi:hypothetical protein